MSNMKGILQTTFRLANGELAPYGYSEIPNNGLYGDLFVESEVRKGEFFLIKIFIS